MKYDSNGNLIWAKQFGSSDWASPQALATDAEGNVYAALEVSGNLIYNSEELYTGLSAIRRSVLVKIDPSGNLSWHGLFDENTLIANLAISPSGKLYAVGKFFGSGDFDFSDSEFLFTTTGWDSFMSVYNTDGTFSAAHKTPDNGFKNSAQSLAFYPNNDVVLVGQYIHQINCSLTGPGNRVTLNTAGAQMAAT